MAMTLLMALQSVVSVADMDQFYHPGVAHHDAELLTDPSDIEPADTIGNQSPAAPDDSGHSFVQCDLCHGYCPMFTMGYLPGTLGNMLDKSLTGYQARFSSVDQSSPFRPPIV
jgi:hypothetical protein